MGDLDHAHRRLLHAAGRALEAVGNDLHGKSINLVPLDEGTLRGSAEIVFIVSGARFSTMSEAVDAALARGHGATVDVEVSYNTPYAAAQHEGAPGPPGSWANKAVLDYSHPGTGPKYLEGPLKQEAGRYESILARTVALELNDIELGR